MTLRHDIKTRLGDSWSSPTWAVILPGGLGVDLTDGWTVTASVLRERQGAVVHTYDASTNGVALGSATVTLSNGATVTTSTVELRHTGAQTDDWPVFVGPWDCEIANGVDRYTIVGGSFRTVREASS